MTRAADRSGLRRAAVMAFVLAAAVSEVTAAAEPERRAVPPEILDPPWLEPRRQSQIEALAGSAAFTGFTFVDRLEDSGISFRNRVVDDSGKHHIPVHYDHGNGLAAADVDGDGRPDLYFPNQVGGNQLWANRGGLRFVNVTTESLALERSTSVSASFADVDGDGDADLYVTAVRSGNRLFVNGGDGRFTDLSAVSGLDYKGHSSAAVFFDYDRDGALDLFLANVGVYTSDRRVPVSGAVAVDGRPLEYYRGVADAFSGHLYPERTETSRLFDNDGTGRFTDVSAERQLVDSGWTGDATPLDADEDGWPDLYVLNMQGHDELYRNEGGERFTRRRRELLPRTPWGSMGVVAIDADNDQHMDLFVTDMHSDMSQDIGPEREKAKSRMQWPEEVLRTGGASLFGNAFFRGLGGGRFVEISDDIGVETYWPWGVSAGDLNADGFDDLFITGSMNYPFRYGINSVLLNEAGRRFVDAEFVLGVEPRWANRTAQPWFELDCAAHDRGHRDCQGGAAEMTPGRRRARVVVWGALGSRASVVVDLDADGDLDVVTNDFHSQPMVLVSDLSQRRPGMRYLRVDLHGTRSNRSGWGASVTVVAGGRTYRKVRDGKSGYLSQSLLPLYFGLAEAGQVDRVEVRWPSGRRQVIPGPIAANTLLEVHESADGG